MTRHGRLPPNQFISTPFSPRRARLRETNSPSAFGFDPNKRRALAIEKRGTAIKSRNHNASKDKVHRAMFLEGRITVLCI